MTLNSVYQVGIVGVRGYVGKELLQIILNHPNLKLSWVSSRQLEGQPLEKLASGFSDITIESLSPLEVSQKKTDIVILALPNGFAAPYVKAIEEKQVVQLIIDLSADYRFDQDWQYQVPELTAKKNLLNKQRSQIKISNPGCYATAMQLAIAPFKQILSAPANCFGISGYSGAGTTPSITNQAHNLKENIIAYKLIEHLHEKEVSHQLSHPVRFTPHVADFFRGIHMTVQLTFESPKNKSDLKNILNQFYAESQLVKVTDDIPCIQQVNKTHMAIVGGLTVSQDGTRATVVCCLDNLLKGAASQAIQNINLSLGLNEAVGLSPASTSFEWQQPKA